MAMINFCITYQILAMIQGTISLSSMKKIDSIFNSDLESDIVYNIESKGYLPNEKQLPPSLDVDKPDEVSYLLSKLSDKELIRLLSAQPKKEEYNLDDVVNLAFNGKSRFPKQNNLDQVTKTNRFQTIKKENKNVPKAAYFKLEDKPVNPYKVNSDADPTYVALQKLNNIIYSRPHSEPMKRGDSLSVSIEEEDKKREQLFDVLVSQLKTLCCKNTKQKKHSQAKQTRAQSQTSPHNTVEQMFLIVNDEVKNSANNLQDDLVTVDPDSLDENSSVLLLGPMTTPLSDEELKSVMNHVSAELSKSEYLPLLQQLSDGTLNNENVKMMKNLLTGPSTRRYIKPHRCNHQSQLARVYGGPKWLICTGYLNLNRPSLYD